MTGLSVTDAILSRKSIRIFTDEPVAAALVREILEIAGRSPSGGNLQPWKVYALAGDAKDRLVHAVVEHCRAKPFGAKGDIPVYPEQLGEPWRSRRHACGELMYQALGIPQEDKPSRIRQVLKNFTFFGAPVGLIVTTDRGMTEAQIHDCGIFLQSIMLLARERGLDSCPQASWTMWPGPIRRELGLAENEMVMPGLSLGYADKNEPVNQITQARMAPDEFIDMRGF